MASTTFSTGTVIASSWLNDVNTATYTDVPAIKADNWVTSIRIADGNVTFAKLAPSGVYGTAAGNLVQLDGSAKLPAIDGSQLTNLKINNKIQPITASVASNALTLTLNPTQLDFRSSTLGSGTVNTRTIATAISVVVPNTATLGTVNATAARLALIAIDNAGTVELAVINCAATTNLDETTLINTTAIAAGSNSLTFYSTTARTGVPFRVVGFVNITEATAGTWATAPSTIQGVGGLVLSAIGSIGYGQQWTTVTGSRTSGTTYYNTTGRPIVAKIYSTVAGTFQIVVGGLTAAYTVLPAGTSGECSAIVPVGKPYSYTYTAGGTLLELS